MAARQVLVVDDSKGVRTLLAMALSQNGFDVTEAEDGQAALEVLDGRPLDVVICDLNMPRMDGYEFARHVRSDAGLARVPIIMVTLCVVASSLAPSLRFAFGKLPLRP